MPKDKRTDQQTDSGASGFHFPFGKIYSIILVNLLHILVHVIYFNTNCFCSHSTALRMIFLRHLTTYYFTKRNSWKYWNTTKFYSLITAVFISWKYFHMQITSLLTQSELILNICSVIYYLSSTLWRSKLNIQTGSTTSVQLVMKNGWLITILCF